MCVTAVLVYHLDSTWLRGGFAGVDGFFVISGYVVSSSMLHHRRSTRCGFLVGFYARRIRRLGPALIFVLLATVVLIGIFVPSAPQTRTVHEYWQTGLSAAVGFSNIRLATWQSAGGYWATKAGSTHYDPFTHTWSLGVEEQFYLCFPLLFLVSYGVQPTCSRHLALPVMRPWTLFGLGLSSSLALSTYLSVSSAQLAFYLMPSRFWQLLSGVCVAHCEHAHPNAWGALMRCRWLMALLDALGPILLISAFATDGQQAAWPVPWSLLTVAGSLCIIVVGGNALTSPNAMNVERVALLQGKKAGLRRWLRCLASGGPLVPQLLGCWLPVYIGKVSYPLYLWHWPLIVLARHTTPFDECNVVKATVAVASLSLAAFTYHIVEGFIQRWGPPLRRPRHIAFALLPPYLATVALYWFLANGNADAPILSCRIELSALRDPASAAPVDHPRVSFNASLDGGRWPTELCDMRRGAALHVPAQQRNGSSVRDNELGGRQPPCFSADALQDWRATWLTRPHNDASLTVALSSRRDGGPSFPPWHRETPAMLAAAAPSRPPVAFVLGDSKTGATLLALRAATWGRWTVVDFGLSSHPYCVSPNDDWHYTSSVTEAVLTVARSGDLVVIASYYHGFLSHDAERCAAQMRTLLAGLRAAPSPSGAGFPGAALLMLGDNPRLPRAGLMCAAPWSPAVCRSCSSPCEVPRISSWQEVAPTHERLRTLARDEAGAFFLDLHDLFCNGTHMNATCGPMIPGTKSLAFMDAIHLTDLGAFYMWPFLRAFIQSDVDV